MTFPLPDEGATKWMMAYSKRHYWRVAAWMDFDDLIQDGYYAWCEVCHRYPSAVNNPAHIMSLFKLCFADKITDLSRSRTKQQDDARSDLVEVFDGESVVMPDPSNFNLLLTKAPKLVKDVIDILTSDKNKEQFNKPYEKQPSGRRETLNDRICTILGLDPKYVDAVRETKLYFSQ